MLELRKQLDPTDYQLNGGIKILNAEIDAYLCEDCTSLRVMVWGSSSMAYSQPGRMSKPVWINMAIYSHGSRLSVAGP